MKPLVAVNLLNVYSIRPTFYTMASRKQLGVVIKT